MKEVHQMTKKKDVQKKRMATKSTFLVVQECLRLRLLHHSKVNWYCMRGTVVECLQ
jgi:hypothetical protein